MLYNFYVGRFRLIVKYKSLLNQNMLFFFTGMDTGAALRRQRWVETQCFCVIGIAPRWNAANRLFSKSKGKGLK